ncbi:hypothetical protein BN2476_1380035 [Paraburkholderia piptadeniae]|uniref:Uncharacterized protein n=1 Tax=Paraburkholderia piptadeniae TaxID=1701573 RepID=A0A1N7SWF3_9BURK|nr:hypothetical protein BN2476_1380035 [Paraburkholderia piptadeniae]
MHLYLFLGEPSVLARTEQALSERGAPLFRIFHATKIE